MSQSWDAVHYESVELTSCTRDVHAVCTDMQGISRQRWSLRFIRARQYSAQLNSLAKRLDQADACFMVGSILFGLFFGRYYAYFAFLLHQRTIATSTEMKSTQILACVQPLREEVHRLLIRGQTFFLTRLPLSAMTGHA